MDEEQPNAMELHPAWPGHQAPRSEPEVRKEVRAPPPIENPFHADLSQLDSRQALSTGLDYVLLYLINEQLNAHFLPSVQ